MRIRCDKCNGRRRYMDGCMMTKDCAKCHASGYVDDCSELKESLLNAVPKINHVRNKKKRQSQPCVDSAREPVLQALSDNA